MTLRLLTWRASLAVAIAGSMGCGRPPSAGNPETGSPVAADRLRVEFAPDGASWRCNAGTSTVVFLDDDKDGFADACEVMTGGALARKIVLPRRKYEGFTPIAGGLKPEVVTGVNMIILPVHPLPDKPMRSERIREPHFVEYLCTVLNDKSFTWREMEVVLPRPEVIDGRFLLLPDFKPLGIEIWIEGEPEPLTIMLRFLGDSYDGFHYGLRAEWRGEQWLFGNDDIALLFSGFSGVGTAVQRANWHLFGSWCLPGGPFQRPTFFGGIPIKPNGTPVHEVTTEDKIAQTGALLRAYQKELLAEPLLRGYAPAKDEP